MSMGAFFEAVADIAIDRRQYLRAFLKAIAVSSLHGAGSGRTLCGSHLALSVSSRGGGGSLDLDEETSSTDASHIHVAESPPSQLPSNSPNKSVLPLPARGVYRNRAQIKIGCRLKTAAHTVGKLG